MAARPAGELAPSNPTLATVFWIAIALAALSAFDAILSARDLVYDGSYYLLGIAAHNEFQLWEPARLSVQLLQQCFAVAGARLGIQGLLTLGRLYALGASGWPVLLTAVCWFVLPRNEKIWIVGPLINLVFVIPATNFIGVGEGIIASCLFWLAFLLVCFRIDTAVGALAAAATTVACAFTHESAAPGLVVIAAVAALRTRDTTGSMRLAALVVAVTAAAAACNMLRWIAFPRSAIERGDFLVSLAGGFLGTLAAPNLPAFASLVAAAAILVAFINRKYLTAAAAVLCFAAFAVVVVLLFASAEEMIAPSRFFAARGLPVAISTLLSMLFLLLRSRGLRPTRLATRPVLTIVLGLAITQAAAQSVITERWDAYVHNLRGLLLAHEGVISHALAMEVLDPGNTRLRRELLESWSVEPLSIVLARRGHVTAVVEPASKARWIPYRFDDPATLPQAPQLDWSGFAPRPAR